MGGEREESSVWPQGVCPLVNDYYRAWGAQWGGGPGGGAYLFPGPAGELSRQDSTPWTLRGLGGP